MEESGSSSILRLRGLPYSATEEDVKAFLGEETPPVVVYLGSKNGKNTGEAYVELQSGADARKALQERQHQHMGSRYIEIFVAAEAELLAQTSGGDGARPSLSGHVVRLRGLPFSSTAQDVLDFFEGVDTLGGEAGVVFTCNADGRPTGEAYVEVADEEALAAALERHKEKIGTRYIEIFQSSKGDMFQAVQQHGYFTTSGSRRRHHGHAASGPPGGPGGQYMQDGGGGPGPGRGRGGQVDEMTHAFAGFGLSQRDVQVPGPPRWGTYGAPADQQYQQYMGGPPRQMGQGGGMPAGGMRWRPAGGSMVPGGGGMQHFNPAPGPPSGKSGRGGLPNGTRTGGHGSTMYPTHDSYGSHGGQAMMFNPFMMQHPLMMGAAQHQAGAWGAPGMMQQQGGAWYGGMQVARGGPGMQMAMGGYSHFPQGYFQPMRSGPGLPSQPSGGSHYASGMQYGGRQQQQQQSQAAAGSTPGGATHAASNGGQQASGVPGAVAAVPAASSSLQPEPVPLGSRPASASSAGAATSPETEQPAAVPAALHAAASPTVKAASPATPEQ